MRAAPARAVACAAGVMLLGLTPLAAAPTPPAWVSRAIAAPQPKAAPSSKIAFDRLEPSIKGDEFARLVQVGASPQKTDLLSRTAARRPRLPAVPLPLPRPPELTPPPATASGAPLPLPRPGTETPNPPAAAPSEPAVPPPDPAVLAACRAEFAALGGEAKTEAKKAEEPEETPATGVCAIPGPVTFSRLHRPEGPDITLDSAITVRCTLAVELARWITEDLAPIAKAAGTTLTGLTGVGGHACRPRNGQAGAQISEHASGNAFDLLGLTFADGREIALWQSDAATRDIRAEVQKRACSRFRTVLGPGADSAHANHVHLDMRQRRADYAMCQWNVE